MKKEVSLAIIIGFILGLIITFGIYTANKALKNRQASSTSASPSPQAQASPTPSHNLTVTSPADEALLDQDQISLTGSTSAHALVTILTEKQQLITYADASGNFQVEIKLIGGANDIFVTALTPQGQEAKTQLTLVYSTAKI